MSASLNKCFLIGNCTRDPELRHTPKGTAICELGLAINRTWTDEGGQKKEEVTFVDVTLWARQAEVAAQFLHKGSPALIEGRLQLDQWDDKQTGEKRSKLKIVGDHIQLIASKPEGTAPASKAAPRPAVRRSPAPRDPDLDPEPSDIPF